MAQEQAVRAKPTNPSTGSETVTIASKLPMDLIMQLHDFQDEHEPVVGGGVRNFKIARPRHGAKRFLLLGNSWAQNKGPHQRIESGCALTPDIPKDFWEEWLDQNKDGDFIKNGMIFASAEHRSVVAQAKEMESVKSGLERLDPAEIHKHGLATAFDRTAPL